MPEDSQLEDAGDTSGRFHEIIKLWDGIVAVARGIQSLYPHKCEQTWITAEKNSSLTIMG
jgi:hypothetical protein